MKKKKKKKVFLEPVCNPSRVAAPKQRSEGLVLRQEQSASDFLSRRAAMDLEHLTCKEKQRGKRSDTTISFSQHARTSYSTTENDSTLYRGDSLSCVNGSVWATGLLNSAQFCSNVNSKKAGVYLSSAPSYP